MFSARIVSVILMIFIYTGLLLPQDQKKARVSPKASVMQIVGLTSVNINYSRPGVKGRVIWGDLVPYNKVWRAGADEATKFTFSSDVTIEGKKLSAGSYSFFVIPNKTEWILIFNKAADQWGAFEYNESEDALRITAKPDSAPFQEWLSYSFSDMKGSSALINLIWEKQKVSFRVEANQN